jgi:hypothetical protein
MFVAVVDSTDLAEEQFKCFRHVAKIDFLTRLDFIGVDFEFPSEYFS